MYVDLNGDQIFYSNGNGVLSSDQPSIVFVHGAGMDHTVWVMPARYFARHGYNVVALDLPGHGLSQGAPLTSIEAMADWLSELIELLGLSTVSVVGHSMGSLVALMLTADHPEKVTSLALLGTAVPMMVSENLLNAAEKNSHSAIDMSNTWSHSSSAQIGGNENPGIWLMVAEERLLERASEGVYFADFTACNNFSKGDEVASAVICSTLIIAGAADQMTPPKHAKKLAALIKNSRVVVIENCGHSMLSEKPDRILDELTGIV